MFTENTTMMTVQEGQNITIWCEVRGTPSPNVTWLFNGQPIPLEDNKTEGTNIAGKTPINFLNETKIISIFISYR